MKRKTLAARGAAGWIVARVGLTLSATILPTSAMAQSRAPLPDYGDISIKGFPDAIVPAAVQPGDNRDTARAIENQRSLAAAPPPSSGFGISGDWNGFRTKLADSGIKVSADYLGQTAYLASGGPRHGTTYVGMAILGVTADLGTLIGDKGGSIQVILSHLHGENLEARTGVVTAGPVQANWGRGTVGRLTALIYKKTFGENLSVTVGRMPFIAFDTFSCEFMNVAFCATYAGHNNYEYIGNPPVSQWAGWARIGSTRRAYLQFGAFVTEPKNYAVAKPFEFGNFGSATGVLLPVELGIFPKIGRGQLPGSYKIGGWVDTSTTNDIVLNSKYQPIAIAGGDPLRTKGRHGVYLTVTQQIARFGSREQNRGATVFFNAVQADKRTSYLQREISGGAFIRGALAARPNDTIGVGIASTRINPRLVAVEKLAGILPQYSERVIEFYYGAQIVSGIVLQPSVQIVHKPAGVSEKPDLVVLGLKTAISF